jgi:diguanylate cyclase (GGDEF)-like protein/PAS domain S-box-containing protein
MRFSPENAGRWARTLVVACLIYSAACALVLLGDWGSESAKEITGAWGSFPLIVVTGVVLWPVITDRSLSVARRSAYRWLFAALVLDMIASVGWGYDALTANETYGSWPDVLYLFYYPMAAVACALLYVDLGGRLDSARSIIDVATIALGFGALLWFTALEPLASMDAVGLAANWSAAGYGIGNAVALIAGALVAMQITDWRSERAIVWLLVAMVSTLIADLLWINEELRGEYAVGAGIDVVYYFFYLCIILAARAERRRREPGADTRGLQGDLRGSLPMVALSTGIIALLDDRLGLTSFQSPLLIAVMIVATLLVIASQALATREVVTLHREVATRRFDERLTELVRRSSDMIAICDTQGVIRYASPSSEQLLGSTPAELAGQRLDEVLGPEAAHVRDAFNQVLRAAHSEQTAVFSIQQPQGEKRSYKMVIANLCHVESIRGITLNIRDVSDAARLNDQLRTLAFHDPLTLLANRALFSDRVHQAIRHIPDGMTPAVLFIDLDNFKTVNDSLGHGAGDQLLRAFAQRLVQCTRAGDTVARLGGDEFAVLLDHVPNTAAAMAVARQVIELCKQPFELDGQPARVGASVGVSIADRVSTAERLLRNADAAMYAAKANGKGHAEVFAPEMLRAARRRIRLENELATAIEQRQFEVHYQPIVDLASRHLVGVEALIRWRHPTRGLVMPGEFIPLAEETGQIVPMTEWVLDRACADLAQLQRRIESGQGVRMSVNMSSRYLNRGNIVQDIRAALEAHRIPPEGLILEVSESLLLENSAQIEQTFKDLKLLGVRLALDDFGTGYSSLAYLHRFPIDILKIDRSFVERLGRQDDGSEGVDAAALARAILSLADALGLDTVAEGIEVDLQRDKLLELGCKTGQGYAFGKPMPMHEIFEAAVTRRRSVLGGNVTGRADFTATGRFRGI